MRHHWAFKPVTGTTAPSFQVTALGAASTANAFESTALNRVWQGPSNRAVRLASQLAPDFYVNFGSSGIVASSSDGILVLGGTVEEFYLEPDWEYISIIGATTDVTVNVTPGYGA